jgi:5-methylcytosine-specific restriction endonuclease McrA
MENEVAKYASHAEKLRAYREADRDKYLKQRSDWRKANIEKARASSRLWYLRNKDRIKRETTPESREKELIRCREKTARRRSAEGSFTQDDIARIRHQQRNRCAICRSPLRQNWHADHINPLIRGGTNHARNIQITCAPCNLAKGSKEPMAFMRELGKLL